MLDNSIFNKWKQGKNYLVKLKLWSLGQNERKAFKELDETPFGNFKFSIPINKENQFFLELAREHIEQASK